MISGYLISSIIFNDILNDTFSITRFYQRRIRRIFPSLIIVMLVSLIAGWFLLWPHEYRNLGKHVAGGAGFISNLLLWRESGYFDRAVELKPMLHLWSLGVEEQFYIFFPLLCWLAYRLRPANTFSFLATLFAMSFTLCSFGSLMYPEATFYLPVTRLWELLIGCVLACIQKEYRTRFCTPLFSVSFSSAEAFACRTYPILRNIASLLGLAMILGSAFLLTARQPFPGAWALIPTLGTAIVIAVGKESFVNRRVLGNQALVAIGLISYPLYLWHWPLLFFARTLWETRVSRSSLAAGIGIAFLLAALTYWCIERPIRFRNLLGSRTSLVLLSAMTGVFFMGLFVKIQIIPARLASCSAAKFVEEAANDWKYPFTDNFQRRSGFKNDAEIGMDKARPATLFIGDSHMQQYWPRLQWALEKLQSNSCPIILLTAGGTITLPNVNRSQSGFACDRFFQFAIAEAGKTNVGRVVFCCWWEVYFRGGFGEGRPAEIYLTSDKKRTPLRLDDPGAEKAFDEFGQAVGQLVGKGKQVYIILSPPCCATWSPGKVSRVNVGLFNTNRLGVPREEFESFVFPVEKKIMEVVVANGGKIINPREAMEEGGFFYGRTVEGRFRYIDASHMRPFYVIESTSFLDTLIDRRLRANVN